MDKFEKYITIVISGVLGMMQIASNTCVSFFFSNVSKDSFRWQQPVLIPFTGNGKGNYQRNESILK